MYQERRTMGNNAQFGGRYPRQGMTEEKVAEEKMEEVGIQAEECGCTEDCGCDCGYDDKCSCNDGCGDGCGGNNMLWLVLLLLFWK